MKLYEIFINNRLEYEDNESLSKLIVANNQKEAESRAESWMKQEFSHITCVQPIFWAEEIIDVDGFKITVSK